MATCDPGEQVRGGGVGQGGKGSQQKNVLPLNRPPRSCDCLRSHRKWTSAPSVCEEVEEGFIPRPHPPLIQGPLKQGFGSLHFQDNEFGDEAVVFCASYRDIQRKNLGPEVRGTQSRPGVKPRALRLHEIELDPV